MVDHADQRENTQKLVEILDLYLKPTTHKSNQIVDLYLKGGFTVDQLSKKFDCSKSTILDRLARAGLKNLKQESQKPDNYRNPQAPYGYKVKDRRLVLNKNEIVVCRLVVRLRNIEKKNFSEIARALTKHLIKNRFGKVSWNYMTAQKIYKRWNGKI
jgi:predicted DNA-binding protein YlxM (UPF0122 family)